MFLTGETASSQAYWNKVELSLASLLGIPQYEKGTGYVPNTGPAILHKGEAVIPAEQADGLRASGLILVNLFFRYLCRYECFNVTSVRFWISKE
jgi:hypothetical protein